MAQALARHPPQVFSLFTSGLINAYDLLLGNQYCCRVREAQGPRLDFLGAEIHSSEAHTKMYVWAGEDARPKAQQ